MAQALVKNNAYSTLAAGISSGATSLSVAVGHGSRFPAVSGGNFFYATLVDTANTIEIVKVLARAGDVMTVTRGQDGTTASAYLLGDRIELRPTAALFDDKMSKGGGIFTGPIEVPAGAATTQAPQVQEVVKRSGDSMTGPLSTPEATITTLKSTAGIIGMPTGHRVAAADVGGLVAPGMIIQTAYLRADNVTTYSYTTAAGDAVSAQDITALDLVFTPLLATSKVLLTYMVSGDANSQNFLFALRRNGTLIGQNSNGTNRWYGFAPVYTVTDSRPGTWKFFYLDSPASASALTYKLQYQSSQSGAVAHTFYLNRPASGSNASLLESGISQVLIQEIAQ